MARDPRQHRPNFGEQKAKRANLSIAAPLLGERATTPPYADSPGQSQTVKEFKYLGRVPINSAYELSPQHSLFIDDIGLWKLNSPIKVLDSLAGVSNRHEIDSVFHNEAVKCRFIFIRANRQHDDALCL